MLGRSQVSYVSIIAFPSAASFLFAGRCKISLRVFLPLEFSAVAFRVALVRALGTRLHSQLDVLLGLLTRHSGVILAATVTTTAAGLLMGWVRHCRGQGQAGMAAGASAEATAAETKKES